jgi:hypothetical protein
LNGKEGHRRFRGERPFPDSLTGHAKTGMKESL